MPETNNGKHFIDKHERLFYKVFFIFCVALIPEMSYGQSSDPHFHERQAKFPHVSAAWKKYNDSLRTEFTKKGLEYPPTDLYIRAFKSQNELEAWVRNPDAPEYKLFHTFRVCALSGELGPKRKKGDLQVPEGCYYIDSFNPNSNYYLSLALSYPNYSDLKAIQQSGNGSGKTDPGGDIFIHGGCVTIGCLPLMDEGIKELYVLCMNAHEQGQQNIPVQIFPTRFTKNGVSYLKKEYGNDESRLKFWNTLKESYDYFEKYHRPLPVMYTPDGQYAF